MSKSIRYYYFTSIVTVLLASVLVMGLVQTFSVFSYLQNDKEEALDKVMDTITLGVYTGHIRPGSGPDLAVQYMVDFSDVNVYITEPNGLVIYSTAPDEVGISTVVPDAVRQSINDSGAVVDMSKMDGFYSHSNFTKGKLLITAQEEHMGYIFAYSDASNLRVYFLDLASSFLLTALISLMVSGLLAFGLTNRVVIPVTRVNAAARRFGEGDYSVRVPVEGDDELAQLAITFNEMANSFVATDTSRRSFMGNIAHELRTPMTTIKGFIDGMLDGTIPEDQRDKYLVIVSEEVGRLARLTSNMLDISKLETGEYVPETVTFDMWQLITSVVLSSAQRIENDHIEVRGMRTDTPVMALGDKDFVHQIFFNLLDNAIKFTDDGGTIDISVKSEKNYVTVSIRNTGDGLSDQELARVFERFYKSDKSRGVNASGSGLGLHISKVLVKLMGGRIWGESEKGSWTQFNFTLPAAPTKKAPRKDSTPPPGEQKGT